MSGRLLTMLAGVAALAMLVAGCGGSDEEPLTKAEFIKQADVICKEANKEIETKYGAFAKAHEIETANTPSRDEGMEIATTIFLPVRKKQVEELAELSPPSDDVKAEAFVAAAEEGVEKGEADHKVLFIEKKYPFTKVNDLAGKYGFKVCRF